MSRQVPVSLAYNGDGNGNDDDDEWLRRLLEVSPDPSDTEEDDCLPPDFFHDNLADSPQFASLDELFDYINYYSNLEDDCVSFGDPFFDVAGPSGEQQGGGGSGVKRPYDSDDEEEEDNSDKESVAYDLRQTSTKRSTKMRTDCTDYKLKVDLPLRDTIKEALEDLEGVLDRVLDDTLRGVQGHDYARITIDAPSLKNPIALPFMRRHQLTPQRIMGVIETVVQSNEQFVFQGDFELHVIRTHLPLGAGKNTVKNSCTLNTCDLETWRKGKKSIIRIRNSDELCAARAIVVGMGHLTKDPNYTKLYKPTRSNTRNPSIPLQTERAKVLHSEAGVPEGPCGIPEIQQFQRYLGGQGFELNVVSREHANTVIYSGGLPDPKYRLYLYYAKGHFDYISSMAGLLGRCYYCTVCKKGYNNKQHKCVNLCYGCGELDCSPLAPPPEQDHRWNWRHCTECNRYFRTPKCFENHKLVKPRGLVGKKDVNSWSYCQLYHKCETCGKRVDMIATRKEGREHVCGEYKCSVCKEVVPPDHLCYVTVGADALPKGGDDDDSMRIIIFDFEAMPLEQKHTVNFVGVQKLCDTCKGWPMDRLECGTCGLRKHSFVTVQAFCDWLFGGSNGGYTCLAHNFKGYDSYFILEYLFENGIKPNVIFTGGKVMHLKIDSLKIDMKCTLDFLQMPLSKLPKAFGFDHVTQKGFSPTFLIPLNIKTMWDQCLI
ncbi:uncharacterized protein LOC116619717 [Nematostella vectensis]|uniref:uncharacterized protein LOC116619717 n=1 Tax=Nematostella vectensis TaxID=45351 RepID=UPI0020774B9A|nr:uncharacterized protein LOC116619717 [Nematostella vectensis]